MYSSRKSNQVHQISWLLLLSSQQLFPKKIESILYKVSMKKVKKLLKTTWKYTVKKYKKFKNSLMTSESKTPNILTNSKPRYISFKIRIKQYSRRLRIKNNFRLKDQIMTCSASLFSSNLQAAKELSSSYQHKSVLISFQRFYK